MPKCGGTEFFMKFKKLISLMLIAVLAVSLVSCKSGSTAAKDTVTNFMTALATYDMNEMSKYIEDFPDNTGTAYKHDIYTEDYYRDLYEAANTKLSYSITSATANEVKLNVTMPDIYTLYQNTFMSVLSQAMSDENMQNYVLDEENDPQLLIIALMINEINENGIDTVNEEITLSVGKINDEYRIKTDDQLKLLLTSKLSLAQTDAAANAADQTIEE